MDDYILIHYSEIYLKGHNRSYFESKLVENIRSAISDLDDHERVKKILGRILIKLKEGKFDKKEYKSRLRKVPGIANFSFCINSDQNIEEIKKAVYKKVADKDFGSFGVNTNRANKDFSYDSQEINEIIGGHIDNNFDAHVDLDEPDLCVDIEIVRSFTFVYTHKVEGVGGLPVGSVGEVLSLMSSGIDSPVASWKMMRRGCKVSFCHFHSFPFTNKKAQINVERIVEQLTNWQQESDLFLVNLNEIQKEIIKEVDGEYRLLLYRREMFRLAEKIAKQKDFKGLVTGESAGQVASQTLENMSVTSEAVSMPIYRPNIGSHKQEITDTAKKLKTYEISIEEVEDCCSYMVADHPETKAELGKILSLEKELDLETKRKQAINNLEHKLIN
ncbi:MAG: tRNA uracil 4-sulfurtransferase ThiI [Candidatus Magasanikbacteria bacterium]